MDALSQELQDFLIRLGKEPGCVSEKVEHYIKHIMHLVYADEATCAANGLDWALLDEEHDDEDDFEGADHGDGCECGCGHDHDHHHHHHGCDCGCEDDYEQN